jgi:F420-0:gamma-glutamyl ligase
MAKDGSTESTPKKPRRKKIVLPVEIRAHRQKAKALIAYREHGTVTWATQAAGIDRSTWYLWLNNDPLFAREAEIAEQAVADELEAQAIKRAVEGDTTLIIFLLKNLKREKYGEKQQLILASPEVMARLERQAVLFTERLTGEALGIVRRITDEVWR